jgi:hypothetical protein
MRVNRQAVILGMRFGLFVLILAVNAYVILTTKGYRPNLLVVVVSLLTIPLFHIVLAGVWEPFRLRRIARKSGENFLIAPHYAWDLHRDSRSDFSNVPGTLALTDRSLRFVSSPLFTDEDITRAIPLQTIVQITDVAPGGKWGHFLTLTLSDGAKMRLKFMSKGRQNRWLQEIKSRIYESV